jgi:hypothetical protein
MEEKKFFSSHGGTLIGWAIFLVALFLPIENLLSINSNIIGIIVITLPIAVLFFARAIDGLINEGNMKEYLYEVIEEA